MGYPTKLLGADEQIMMSLRPHSKQLAAPVVVVLTTSAIAAYLTLIIPESDWRPWLRGAVVLVWLLIVLAWVVRPFLMWWFTQYAVTNKRLIVRTGVFSRSGYDIPLRRIKDVSFDRTWIERVLGSGTLHVESTSERGPLRLIDIPHVENVQRDLNELITLDERRQPPAEPDRERTHPPNDQADDS